LFAVWHEDGGKPGVEQAVNDAVNAHIYGYPLVTMDVTRKVMTNVMTSQASRAPMGQLIKLRKYPAVDDHAVTARSADTLYTIVRLNVSRER
jgi:hypothetical protein